MAKCKTYSRRKIFIAFAALVLAGIVLITRLVYLMIIKSEYYSELADDVHQRERSIKAPRGKIYDVNGEVLATNKTVCTVSVINSQITEPEKVIDMLVLELGIDKETARNKVEKVSSIEKIKSNVDKETGDIIRAYNLDGVKVDEDYKRYYPYSTLASKVLGFAGADNQGIIGLEVQYDSLLQGIDGKILTTTDSQGIEVDSALEERIESVAGNDLYISLDVNIQKYAEQIAYKTLEEKQANYVAIIVMNPQSGEIMAMVNAPEFDLNDPYTLNYESDEDVSDEEYQDLLNQMWRNQCINDTYEPGSTFKIITASAALEEEIAGVDSTFNCQGYIIVDGRRIKCHKTTGHGSETFLEATMNSCNPVFIEVGLRLGVTGFYTYLNKFQIIKKTGIDLPGEAATIIHEEENTGQIELATMSFGQSFQLTPVRFLTSVCAAINGGKMVTPHFGIRAINESGETVAEFTYETSENIISAETSETMQYILEKVVSEGTGVKGYIEGYYIGGKTATSQKLPRSANKYIASYIAFAPADDPEVIAIAIVDEPQGTYYGGSVAAPMIKELYENILPYLGIEMTDTGSD